MSENESKLETMFSNYWRLMVPDLPEPEREQQLIPGRQFRCDFVFRSERIVIEIDGGQYAPNGGRHNGDKDKEKINLLTLHGWKVFRYSGNMLRRDPEAVVMQVRQAVLKARQAVRA